MSETKTQLLARLASAEGKNGGVAKCKVRVSK